MTTLRTETSFANPDATYEMLVEAHRGLPEGESTALNARLVLVLANHIGDLAILKEAVALAKKAG